MDLSGPVCVCLCCVWSHQIESWLNIKGWTSLCRITTTQICSAAPSAPSLPLSLLQLINLLVSLSTISSSYYHLGYKRLSACIWPLSSRIPLLWTDLDQFKSASVGGPTPRKQGQSIWHERVQPWKSDDWSVCLHVCLNMLCVAYRPVPSQRTEEVRWVFDVFEAPQTCGNL